MSTKASTAALDRFCQRLLLPQRRASLHPASGLNLQKCIGAKMEFRNPRARA
jgi:hypothetical protein